MRYLLTTTVQDGTPTTSIISENELAMLSRNDENVVYVDREKRIYTYDQAGNRITHVAIALSPTAAQTDSTN